MPRVDRQKPPAPPSMEPGSILATSVPVAALMETYARVCIYGRNRSGKTTLAAQFAKPLLHVSSEPDACGGATSIANITGVMSQRVSHRLLGQDAQGRWVDATDPACVRKDKLKGSAKLRAIATELMGKHPFRTVVLDTVTSLQELILVELMGWDKVPEIQHVGMVGKETYQYRAEKWREVVHHYLDVSNCNLVVLAQEKDHNPPTDDFGGKRKILHTMQQGSFMAPALGATNAQWLQDSCGYVVQIYEDEVMQEIVVPVTGQDGKPMEPSIQRVGTGKRQRHLRLLYHPNFAAGGRWQFDTGIPESVTAPDPQGLYAALARYIPALAV